MYCLTINLVASIPFIIIKSYKKIVTNEGWILTPPTQPGIAGNFCRRFFGNTNAQVKQICQVTERSLQYINRNVPEFCKLDYEIIEKGIDNLEKNSGQTQAISAIFKKLKDDVRKLALAKEKSMPRISQSFRILIRITFHQNIVFSLQVKHNC